MTKYRNKKTIYNGVTFDSIAELRRYKELALLLHAGKISGLELQKEYELIPKQKGERSVKYKADFVYYDDDRLVVEDVKGVKTQAYIIKRKLMLKEHGIRVKEIF